MTFLHRVSILSFLFLPFPTDGQPLTGGESKPSFVLSKTVAVNVSAAAPIPNAGVAPCDDPSPNFIDLCIDSDMELAQPRGDVTAFFIPPDPHGAAGPSSIVAVTNTEIEILTKGGHVITPRTPLQTMFNSIGSTFDPKVLYDVHRERFVVVDLDSDKTTYSSILVAVSRTNNPQSTTSDDWFFLTINSLILEDNGVNTWADYPGIAVDEEALYITANMFEVTGGVNSVNSRVWIINKTPFYDGGIASFKQYDFIAEAGAGLPETHMPAMVRNPEGIGGICSTVGTYLVAYNGLTDGTDEFLQTIRIDSPLTNPSFTQDFVLIGDLEDDPLSGLPNAPQLGSSELIETNNQRALDAVWVNNTLWMVTTIQDPAGETSAYWFKLNADGVASPTIADQGFINGEDIGPNTYTYFPSIDVNSKGVAAFGFAASSPSIYGSAYATIRDDTMDEPGMVRPSDLVKAGTHPYFVTFGEPQNRWGDYTGMVLDPVDDDCFWAFNQYASTPCYTGTNPEQSGCWSTAWARLCYPEAPPPPAGPFSCFNVGDLHPFDLRENGQPNSDALKAILEYHNTFVAEQCGEILDGIDDCVGNYEELMCSLEAGYHDLDACEKAKIELPLYFGAGSVVSAYAASTFTFPNKFKINCPSCDCTFARKYVFPSVDQLAPFCPFFGVGITSKYKVEGFRYLTLIPDDPDQVSIVPVDKDNGVFELKYNHTLTVASQLDVINVNSFTSETAEYRERLRKLTTIKAKTISQKTRKCGRRRKQRDRTLTTAEVELDEDFYDSMIDPSYAQAPMTIQQHYPTGIEDMPKNRWSAKKKLRTNNNNNRLLQDATTTPPLFCNDTFFRTNYVNFTVPPSDEEAAAVFTNVTEGNAAQHIVDGWDKNGDGFITCNEAQMDCDKFLQRYGIRKVEASTFFRSFTP